MRPYDTRLVLESLLIEDRTWTLDELAREIHAQHFTIQDAIGELEAAGLANRVSENMVCASREAVIADELNHSLPTN